MDLCGSLCPDIVALQRAFMSTPIRPYAHTYIHPHRSWEGSSVDRASGCEPGGQRFNSSLSRWEASLNGGAAVSKTVGPKGHGGSNPSASVVGRSRVGWRGGRVVGRRLRAKQIWGQTHAGSNPVPSVVRWACSGNGSIPALQTGGRSSSLRGSMCRYANGKRTGCGPVDEGSIPSRHLRPSDSGSPPACHAGSEGSIPSGLFAGRYANWRSKRPVKPSRRHVGGSNPSLPIESVRVAQW